MTLNFILIALMIAVSIATAQRDDYVMNPRAYKKYVKSMQEIGDSQLSSKFFWSYKGSIYMNKANKLSTFQEVVETSPGKVFTRKGNNELSEIENSFDEKKKFKKRKTIHKKVKSFVPIKDGDEYFRINQSGEKERNKELWKEKKLAEKAMYRKISPRETLKDNYQEFMLQPFSEVLDRSESSDPNFINGIFLTPEIDLFTSNQTIHSDLTQTNNTMKAPSNSSTLESTTIPLTEPSTNDPMIATMTTYMTEENGIKTEIPVIVYEFPESTSNIYTEPLVSSTTAKEISESHALNVTVKYPYEETIKILSSPSIAPLPSTVSNPLTTMVNNENHVINNKTPIIFNNNSTRLPVDNSTNVASENDLTTVIPTEIPSESASEVLTAGSIASSKIHSVYQADPDFDVNLFGSSLPYFVMETDEDDENTEPLIGLVPLSDLLALMKNKNLKLELVGR